MSAFNTASKFKRICAEIYVATFTIGANDA